MEKSCYKSTPAPLAEPTSRSQTTSHYDDTDPEKALTEVQPTMVDFDLTDIRSNLGTRFRQGTGSPLHISSPGADYGLQSCLTLENISAISEPVIFQGLYGSEEVKLYASQQVHTWHTEPLVVSILTCNDLPAIDCVMYAFDAKSPNVLQQFKYGKSRPSIVPSPPLALKQLGKTEAKQYDQYFRDCISCYLPSFVNMCFAQEDDAEFHTELLRLLTSFQPREKIEVELLNNIWRLLLMTYVIGHTLNIEQSCLEKISAQLQTQDTYDKYSFPRVGGRQLKCYIVWLRKDLMRATQKILQQFLAPSTGTDMWPTAFVVLLGLAMILEEDQKTIKIASDRRVREEEMSPDEAEAEAKVQGALLDNALSMQIELFMVKYNRVGDPVDRRRVAEVKGEPEGIFIGQITSLIAQRWEYLRDLAQSDRQGKTGRLVSRVLLWKPYG